MAHALGPGSFLPCTASREVHHGVRGAKGGYRLQLGHRENRRGGRLPSRNPAMHKEELLSVFGKKPRSVRCTCV